MSLPANASSIYGAIIIIVIPCTQLSVQQVVTLLLFTVRHVMVRLPVS